ncbi:CMGC family protein kinase [Trichomonas vaginalis G3]|uniref:cyclin-dependent kinase n=1 Tax=Trichomonas vaginalis (strain ATCC PRA-98 / G3) TaxID=412133 RepID=A2D8G0_TRIV3|nr:protein kinase superfamily [Trichomonas vaginalis G3]EAY23209.1 CMGC family protein kinase [Trichomonas vaginalis G3]KAI5534142.1 protein kinase superfamily [Trichomonas vaginalis G3]|eukprot:XP_001584195.1 CMGC family protein kinase [Trichomonas vaginalis G3]
MKSEGPYVDQYFDFVEKIGKGSNSTVFKVIEKRTKKVLALKKLKPRVKTKDEPDFEIAAHCVLKDENIVKLNGKFVCKRDSSTYLIFDYYDYDLFSVIHDNSSKQLSKDLIKSLSFQLLKAVDCCHKHNVLHRDIKPENIMITRDGVLKLGDFGYAFKGDPSLKKSTNVITPSYRPPEILLGDQYYLFPSDIWSVGCVIYELLTGKALFRPENFTVESQLDKILSIIGTPSNEEIKTKFSVAVPTNINHYDSCLHNYLINEISDEFSEFRELLEKILIFNPENRLTASQLLQLPIFSGITVERIPITFFVSQNSISPNLSSPEIKYSGIIRPQLPKLVLAE